MIYIPPINNKLGPTNMAAMASKTIGSSIQSSFEISERVIPETFHCSVAQFIKFILEKERNTTKQTEKVVCFRELQGNNFKKCQHNFFHDVTLLSSCRFPHTS